MPPVFSKCRYPMVTGVEQLLDGEYHVAGVGGSQDRGCRRCDRACDRHAARYIDRRGDVVGAGGKDDQCTAWSIGDSAFQGALAHAAVQVDGWTSAPQGRGFCDRSGNRALCERRRRRPDTTAVNSRVPAAATLPAPRIARRRRVQLRVAKQYAIGDRRERTAEKGGHNQLCPVV